MSITEPRMSGGISRAQAGLRPPRSISRNITPGNGGVAVHYGGANVPTSSPTQARNIWKSWQDYHMDHHGWVDIAYTMGVDQWGYVYAGRGAGVRTAAQGTNTGNQNYYAVCWIGGANQTPSADALSAIAWCVKELRANGGAGLAVKPHSSFTSTACPGNPLRSHISKIDGVSFVQESNMQIGVFRDGVFYMKAGLYGGSADLSFHYGSASDIPLMGRWSGRPSVGVRRGSTFHLRDGLRGGNADHNITYGRADDTPLIGDWNGNGITTIGIRRGSAWHLKNTLSGGDADVSFRFGRADDIPLVGDWNGNGRDTIGVFRDGTWYLKNSLSGGAADIEFKYGRAGDIPVVGDWNGNGRDSIGIIRDGTWHLKHSLSGGASDIEFRYGTATDVPLIVR